MYNVIAYNVHVLSFMLRYVTQAAPGTNEDEMWHAAFIC